MKKRKGSLLQRMMAVLLAAVLVIGMVSNAAPVTVLAQEPDGQQESVSGNDAELTEEETEPAEGTNPEEPQPGDGTGRETPKPDAGTQGTSKPDAGAKQEIQQSDEENKEQETVNENAKADEGNESLQALLERIAVLPDAVEYLTAEPEDEDAYEEWLAGRYAYAEEALVIQEIVTALSEEEQAKIPEETLAKLAAWVTIAQTAEESTQVMMVDTTSGSCGNNVNWTLTDGVLTISGTGEMEDYSAGTGNPWFDNGTYTNIVKVAIEDGVESIGNNAFYGFSSLTSVSIANTVNKIGISAFSSCTALEEVTIPNGINSIGSTAFMNCPNLQKVTILSENPPECGGSIFYYSNQAKFYVPVCDYLIAKTWTDHWYQFKTVPTTHTGDISYSASDKTITQKCGKCNTEYGTATISLNGTNFIYTGNAIEPVSVTCADSGTNTWNGEKPTATDITYENNTNAGQATAFLKLGGETAAISFTIQPKALTESMVTLSDNSFPYTGNAVTPEVTVQDGGTTLIKDTDYTVSYTSNSAVGTAVVTVTGKGNYSGEITKNYQIVESDADKAKAAKSVAESALVGFTATNATTDTEILGVINAALNNAGITGVIVTIDKFRKTEASTSAVGQVDGVISIRCGQTSECINMEKKIEKLTAGKYTVAVNNGTGGGEYEEGATVTITADSPASGKQFDKWVVNSGSVTLDSETSSTTTFTMPAETVSVTATYKDKAGGSGTVTPEVKPGENAPETNASAPAEELTDSGSAGGVQPENPAPSKAYDPAEAETRVKSEQQGNIYKEVSIKAEDTFDTVIATQIPELADIVLTEAEKQQAAGGTNIKIILEVQDAQNMISSEDKALVEAELNSPGLKGFAVGQYLDISLFKIIGESRDAIHESGGKIAITITVPDSLKNADNNKTRVFALIRVHGGQAELLADLDSDEDTITIETDRFSPYAIVYKDMQGGAKSIGTKDKEPKTGDTEPIEMFATLSMVAGVSYLLLYFTDRRHGMSEETKKEFVSRLVGWARRGGKLRRLIAFLAIFILLVYYHSIGKSVGSEKWEKEELDTGTSFIIY